MEFRKPNMKGLGKRQKATLRMLVEGGYVSEFLSMSEGTQEVALMMGDNQYAITYPEFDKLNNRGLLLPKLEMRTVQPDTESWSHRIKPQLLPKLKAILNQPQP